MAEKMLKSVSKAIKTSVKAKSGSTVVGKTGITKATVAKVAKKAGAKTVKSSVTGKAAIPAAKSSARPKDVAMMTKPSDVRTKAKLTPEERYRMVETAAYFIAERHGFQGRSDEHWAAAERQIGIILDQ
jgi:Protein of unknown function (DUF2934)